MFKITPYFLCYLMPVTYLWGLVTGGIWIVAPLFTSFVMIPIADLIFGRDTENPTPEAEIEQKNNWVFRIVTLLWVPVQLFVVIYSLWFVQNNSLGLGHILMISLSCGIVTGGIGITVAHELCHRQTKLETFASQLILLTTNYMHFHVEHTVGHHRHVSTPEDPASASFNQSLYRFLPQTLIGSLRSMYRFEMKRAKVKKLPWYRNRFYSYMGLQTATALAVLAIFSWRGLVFYMAQSFVAIIFLELVNYIEHYGLRRKKLPNGRYEKVTPKHSWNANHRASNFLLLKLQRHSDHHANPLRRYHILRDMPEAPQLPMGYPGMIILSFFPPLWRRVMNPRVLAYQAQ